MDDEVLDIDLSMLRIREIETIEEIIGGPIDKAFDGEKPRGPILRALGYVVKRRDNPDFTMEDAGNLIINLATPNGNGSDPTDASA